MKTTLLLVVGFLFPFLSTRADADQSTQIQIVDSYNKRIIIHSYADGKGDDDVISYVKLRIQKKVKYEIFGGETELLLSNDAKSEVDKAVICQNIDRTIVGFTTCAALIDYTITIVYTTSRGEVVVNQNFNQKLTELLKNDSPTAELDPTGLYLDRIDGRRLSIGFRSDSGKGSFKFQVQLTPAGQIKMVPKSIVFDN